MSVHRGKAKPELRAPSPKMDPERDIGSTPQGAIPKPFINIKFHGSPFANGGRGNLWPNCRVEVSGKTEGFGHEESSIGVSDRCHHRCHCLGGPVTSSGLAGWLGSRSRGRTNCWRGDRWHSLQCLCVWPWLRLLWRTGLRLLWRLCPRLLRRVRPSVL